jgi:hypothetical protein
MAPGSGPFSFHEPAAGARFSGVIIETAADEADEQADAFARHNA